MSQKNFMSYEDAVAIVSEIASKLGLKVDSSAIGTNGGIAELDSTGKVPSSQLPSFVDDVLEYDSLSNFPATGEAGKIYVAKDTNKTYRWSGSAYVEISPSLALGETSSTAYRGDRGKTAYTHATDSSRLTTATASGLYKVASTAQGHIAGLTAVTKADITGLGIPGSDTNTTYTFSGGTNQFTVTPSGGSAQNVPVTPNDSTKLPLAGGNMTGNIGYTGSKSTSSMIKFMNNTADAYGNGICIGGGGATIIGGGESSDAMAGQVNAENEILYLGNDSDVNIFTNLQNGWDSRKTFTFSANGNVTFEGSFTANSIDATKLIGIIPSGCYTDTKYTAATSAPGAIAASGSAGTSTNYARQDHTHGITVATGDANGQVKIAGQNVSVKGLGDNAFNSTSYLPLAGGTMTGTLFTTPNNVNINFRNHTSYYCTASYQTAGNEALVFATKNAVTSFMFVNGEDSVTNHGDSRWQSITPGLQIKNNCVSINKLIGNSVTPSYNLEVNGTQYVSGVLTVGDNIESSGIVKGKNGLFSGGRVFNAGDDEGIIINQTGNGYAGLILGSHNARRSVFYLNNTDAFWRYNDGNNSYNIMHPVKSGTIALTSDVTNHTDPIFYGTCSTAAGTRAKVVSASKFSGLAAGVVINVKFTNANTVDSPTLNVNDTGAKAIWKSGGNIKSSNPGWMANEVVSFTYDGTRWIMNDVLSSGRLHTQGYNNNCDTMYMTCSVTGRSASLGGLLQVTQASQDLFTIGGMGANVVDAPAQGILINQSTKAIYLITGIDNLFSSVSGTIPVGTYTVYCNFRVTYTYTDFV